MWFWGLCAAVGLESDAECPSSPRGCYLMACADRLAMPPKLVVRVGHGERLHCLLQAKPSNAPRRPASSFRWTPRLAALRAAMWRGRSSQESSRHSTKPTYSGGQYESQACPTKCSMDTGPKRRESLDAPRLSPKTKTCNGGMVVGP